MQISPKKDGIAENYFFNLFIGKNIDFVCSLVYYVICAEKLCKSTA